VVPAFVALSVALAATTVSPSLAWATARAANLGHPDVGVVPGQVVASAAGSGSAGTGSAGTGSAGTGSDGTGSVSLHSAAGVHSAAYADQGVLTFGDAPFFGSPTSIGAINSPVVSMASTSDGGGYWLTSADGGVFSYGDAGYFGSAGSLPLQAPVVGMVGTPDSQGYWQVAIDGGVFTYGDAGFYGSTGSMTLNQPIVGMAATPDGKGYWLVAADGGIFTFGDAGFYGSLGSDTTLPASIVGISPTPDGGGYWLAGSGGGVYAFGDATNYGESSGIQPTEPISAVVSTHDGGGYWLLEPDAFPVSFAHPGPTSSVGAAVVAAAASQIEGDPDTGYFCNPYGPCEAWCALFATWVWEQAGVSVPRYGFVGDVYDWSATYTGVISASSIPAPGDAVFYGTGPWSTASAPHMGIVAQVWPDGAIITVEGDSGPAPEGHYNVTINGPYLPSRSLVYNGFGIFGYGVP
jgi:hypothetical protein